MDVGDIEVEMIQFFGGIENEASRDVVLLGNHIKECIESIEKSVKNEKI